MSNWKVKMLLKKFEELDYATRLYEMMFSPLSNKRRLKIVWSCGVKQFCEHKTKIGASLHIFKSKYLTQPSKPTTQAIKGLDKRSK